MLNVFTNSMIKQLKQLKQRINLINLYLHGEELRIYESGTKYCVVQLVNTNNQTVLSTLAISVSARRDLCLVKAFLSLVEKSRTQQKVLVA